MPRSSNHPAFRDLEDTNTPDYEIGYRRPPVHSRFKAGQSGNPRGRPKGAGNKPTPVPGPHEERLKSIVMEEAYRTIGIRDGDRMIEIPVIQAIVRSVGLNAAKGNQRAQRMFTDLLLAIEGERKALRDEMTKTAIEYKCNWERELYIREKRGETGPEPIPHPDHIHVDLATGEVTFSGPVTKEEKEMWDKLRALKVQTDDEIASLERRAKRKPHDASVHERLEAERQASARIAGLIGD